jgi:hypothetical protein
MADLTSSSDRVDITGTAGPVDQQRRDDWFTASPDPWMEIARLEFGGDRTFASNVQQMILNAEPSQRPELEAKLLQAAERPELTEAGRQFVCRMLAWVGSPAGVPVLARWMERDETADDARLALDAIGGAAVNEVYRQALTKLSGRACAGLIGSIAARGDVVAVDPLTAIAIDREQPDEVRAAAERAVEHLLARSRS